MYPEWIQEQLDKLPHRPIGHSRSPELRLAGFLSERLDRIESKIDRLNYTLDRLLALCEEEAQ